MSETTDDFKAITVEFDENLLVITLNRPDRLNSLNSHMKEELKEILRRIDLGLITPRALLITGAGKGFCAGADLMESGMGAKPGRVADPGTSLFDTYHGIFQELMNLDIPVITAINGAAAGAGMSLAITADFVIAARSAYFLQAFVNIGLAPDAGSSYWLPRLVGPARARRMMMLGEKISAETALDWGLIHEVVDDNDLAQHALAFAKKLSEGPTKSYAAIRRLMGKTFDNSYDSQLTLEAFEQRHLSTSADAAEGTAAFIQKRAAKFTGK